MALILNIDTSTENGSVCLSEKGVPLVRKEIVSQKNHAGLAIPYIKEILESQKMLPRQIDAVAIAGGPGSYTGLRVASATAKGLCYLLDIPLIAINTLQMMAAGFREDDMEKALFCPMIDARRMDVFTALYDKDLNALVPPEAVTLDQNFLQAYHHDQVYIFGSGRDKAQTLLQGNKSWCFPDFIMDAAFLAPLAEQCFEKKQFQDPAYFEPFYLKLFYTPSSPK